MKSAARWGAALSFLLLCGPLQAQEPKACQLNRFSVLPISTLPDGRFTVPGIIQDQSFNFLVDTGGAVMTLTGGKAFSLGLPAIPAAGGLRGVAGTEMSLITYVEHFKLGRLEGVNIPFYIDNRLPHGSDGTLAPDIMKQYDVDIDLAHGAINLFSPKHCPGQVVYWTKGGYITLPMSVVSSGHIEVPVMVDGKKVAALLDTGAVGSVMSMRAAKSIGVSEKSVDLKPITDKDDKYQRYDYPFKTLDFDGITVTTPRLQIVSDGYLPRGIDMLIGANILRRLHLYIAYGEEKLYITPATAN